MAAAYGASFMLQTRRSTAGSLLVLALALGLNGLVSCALVTEDRLGLQFRWLSFRHRLPWDAIRRLEYKREAMGGRLSLALNASETLSFRSFESLEYVVASMKRHQSAQAPRVVVGLPWWLRQQR